MCLPDFVEFKRITKANAITGYRNWRLQIKDSTLMSTNQDFIWIPGKIGRHLVKQENSGVYSYNYNYYYNNNNNNNYYNNYYNNYNYYYNYNYYIGGIVKQYGKAAIHKSGYRSEYAIIDTLFTIRRLDAQGPKEFLDWIDKFNNQIEEVAEKFKSKTTHYQDFTESIK